MIRINLIVTTAETSGRFNVDMGRDRIVTSTADPHHAACRSLVNMGYRGGSAVFFRRGKLQPYDILPILYGAKHGTKRTATGRRKFRALDFKPLADRGRK